MEEFGLTRAERLRGDKNIERLFREGRTGFVYPFKYYYLASEAQDGAGGVSMLVSVPKRMFKRAVKRNLLKRRTREAYRLEKSGVARGCSDGGKILHIAFVYVSKEETEFRRMHCSMKRMLSAVRRELESGPAA